MDDDKLYRKAEERADRKIAFRKHLYGFIVANVFFFLLNLIFSPGEWWFYWITGLWAIGLILHFLKVYVLIDKFADRDAMIEDEMRKMKK